MSVNYDKNFLVTVTGDNQIEPLDYPGRCTLDKVTVLRVDAPTTNSESDEGSIAVDVYSRQFVGPEIPLHLITTDGNRSDPHTYLQTRAVLALKVGDVVTVAGASQAAYDGDHRVVQVVDDYNFLTDRAYVGDSKGGLVHLNIPEAEWELYRVLNSLSGTGVVTESLGVNFTNMDALPNANIGVNRKIYFRFAAPATYRVSIRSHEGIAIG